MEFLRILVGSFVGGFLVGAVLTALVQHFIH